MTGIKIHKCPYCNYNCEETWCDDGMLNNTSPPGFFYECKNPNCDYTACTDPSGAIVKLTPKDKPYSEQLKEMTNDELMGDLHTYGGHDPYYADLKKHIVAEIERRLNLKVNEMAKVTKVNVEAKKSLNFQTYTVGMELSIEDGEDYDNVINTYKDKCRASCIEEFKKDQRK